MMNLCAQPQGYIIYVMFDKKSLAFCLLTSSALGIFPTLTSVWCKLNH